MKLVRFGDAGREQHGFVGSDGVLRALGRLAPSSEAEFASLSYLERLRTLDLSTCARVEGNPRLGSCVSAVGKIVCVGLNYTDHADEVGSKLPPEPLLFMKATSSLTGPFDPIVIPRGATQVDWEIELALIIGRQGNNIPEPQALDYLAGYTAAIDVSERQWQKNRGGQFTKGKSADSFCPLGPFLLTRDEVPNPQNLRLWLQVNNQPRQDGKTAAMVTSVATLIHYISTFMTLHPGDVILTGTPSGVGAGMTPPTFLKSGDIVTCGIDCLTQQRPLVAQRHHVNAAP